MRKCPAINVSKAPTVKLYLNLMINVYNDCNQDLPFLKIFVQDTTRLDRCASTSVSLAYAGYVVHFTYHLPYMFSATIIYVDHCVGPPN